MALEKRVLPSMQKSCLREKSGPNPDFGTSSYGQPSGVKSSWKCVEAILIPSRLIDYGLTNKEALSIYGVLTSMALPFILFPSALTNSMAVLLLPSAAKAQAEKDESRISTMVTLSFRYSCYMGILCIGLFTRFGKNLGTIISIMSCPALLLWSYAGSVRLCIWQLLWEASKMALEKRVLPSCKICLPWGSVWYLCCLQCRCLVSGDIYVAFWSANCF